MFRFFKQFITCRFLHPLVHGEYPKTMQNIVGNRLPKFTTEEIKMVKGSIDYVGINHYTTFYAYDHVSKLKALAYQQDQNCGFASKIFTSLFSTMPLKVIRFSINVVHVTFFMLLAFKNNTG